MSRTEHHSLNIVRPVVWILGGGLILYFFVLPETGHWTALVLFCFLVAIEAQSAATSEQQKLFKITMAALNRVVGPTTSRIRSIKSNAPKAKRKWN